MSEFNDVKKFHEKFGQLAHDKPTHLATRKLEERLAFLAEELGELKDAADLQDLAGMADALVDLVYVAKGTAVMMGLPWKELWDDVQRANLAKVPGQTHRGNLVDVCKPAGWVGPQTKRILQEAGYTQEGLHFTYDDKVYQPNGPVMILLTDDPTTQFLVWPPLHEGDAEALPVVEGRATHDGAKPISGDGVALPGLELP